VLGEGELAGAQALSRGDSSADAGSRAASHQGWPLPITLPPEAGQALAIVLGVIGTMLLVALLFGEQLRAIPRHRGWRSR